ncbi:MAG: LysR family transcriptional regulator [Elusimicrobia bacterium]|nr:LysR family transcriptional regulator [Elusimicrobiota bacterium]
MPLDLNYHHLYYFWACVRSGSLTSAAQELHLSQSALSLQLKSLERALGRRLLLRSRTGVVPTAEGREVFEYCERIFPEGESLARFLRSDSPRAPIQFRIGVGAGLGREVVLAVLDRIGDVPRLIPTLHVESGERVLDRLSRHQLDVALFSGDHSMELGLGYRTRLLDAVPLRFVAAPALAKRLGAMTAGREYPMLLRPAGHPIRIKVEQWMRERGCKAVPVAESSDAELLRILALQGRGVTAVHLPIVREDLAEGRLVRVAGAPSDLMNEIWAACPVRPPVDHEPRRAVELILGLSPIFGKAAPRRKAAR